MYNLNLSHRVSSLHYWSEICLILILGEAVADFTPTWVLVVTWLNLAADEGCRWTSIYNRLYDYSYYYWWNSPDRCKEEAWNLKVRKKRW